MHGLQIRPLNLSQAVIILIILDFIVYFNRKYYCMSQAGHQWCPMYINLTFFYDLDLYRHILTYNYYIVFLKSKKKLIPVFGLKIAYLKSYQNFTLFDPSF